MGEGITNGIIPSGGGVHKGALLAMSSNHSLSVSGTEEALVWATVVYDTDGIWSGSAVTRLTVPAGVTKVRLTGAVRWSAHTTGSRYANIKKNGGHLPGAGTHRGGAGNTQQDWMSMGGAVVEVVAGDYFEIVAQQDSGGALNVEAHAMTWFAMEIIQ